MISGGENSLSMNKYTDLIVKDFQDFENGKMLTTYDGREKLVKVKAFLVLADAPGRNRMLGFKGQRAAFLVRIAECDFK